MKTAIIILSSALLLPATGADETAGSHSKRYEPEWESLLNYQAPEWYEDAKLGFWPIWGVYCVPAFKGDHAAEWYGRWMYCQKGQSSRNNQGLATHLHHKKTYGDPGEFGYKDLIPMFKAENFDADEWADLCVRGGAKFFTMMGSHHDTFCMWDTKLTKWNSVEMGPKRDLVGEVGKAVRKRGLRFGVSNHTAWNYMFFQWNHINGYDAKDPANKDLYGTPIIDEGMDEIRMREGETRQSWLGRSRGGVKPSKRDLDRWLERTKELADLYKPDLYYFDWGINPPAFESRRREFAAHYYNTAVNAGMGEFGSPQVVINYKSWATFKKGSAVRDFERGAFDKINDLVWQTDDSIYYGNNWSYDPSVEIKPTDQIIDQLMDVISKRGVLMLAVAPKADGSFPDEQKKMIYELGDWLKICGEAVYATRPYEVLGEVSKTWHVKDEHGHLEFKGKPDDIRFTRNKQNTVLYATFLDWPGGKAVVKSLADADLSGLKSVRLLGAEGELKWKQTDEGMEVQLPEQPEYGFAYPLRMEFEKQIVSINGKH